MAIIKTEIRSGAYFDSVILMQLQRSLAELPGVEDAGVVMGTEANLELLEQTGLLVDEIKGVKADDLVIGRKSKGCKNSPGCAGPGRRTGGSPQKPGRRWRGFPPQKPGIG